MGPGPLDLKPDGDDRVGCGQLFLPVGDLLQKVPHKLRGHHVLQLDLKGEVEEEKEKDEVRRGRRRGKEGEAGGRRGEEEEGGARGGRRGRRKEKERGGRRRKEEGKRRRKEEEGGRRIFCQLSGNPAHVPGCPPVFQLVLHWH